MGASWWEEKVKYRCQRNKPTQKAPWTEKIIPILFLVGLLALATLDSVVCIWHSYSFCCGRLLAGSKQTRKEIVHTHERGRAVASWKANEPNAKKNGRCGATAMQEEAKQASIFLGMHGANCHSDMRKRFACMRWCFLFMRSIWKEKGTAFGDLEKWQHLSRAKGCYDCTCSSIEEKLCGSIGAPTQAHADTGQKLLHKLYETTATNKDKSSKMAFYEMPLEVNKE